MKQVIRLYKNIVAPSPLPDEDLSLIIADGGS